MHVLSESFSMFTYAGVWLPLHWDAGCASSVFYKIYTFFSITLVYTLTASELLAAVLLTKSIDDFSEISFLLISTINVCCKIVNIILRRHKVVELVDMLLEPQCLPRKFSENEILEKFNKIARFIQNVILINRERSFLAYINNRSIALSCIVLAEMTVCVMSLGPFFQKKENRSLPFKSWLPYEAVEERHSVFWFSYLHQAAAIVICATINVANDSMICGFMLQACSQLELLKHRLLELPKMPRGEAKNIVKHIQHHNHIFKFTESLNSIFSPVIIVQFCMSSVVLSVSVYQLSVKSNNGVQFITMLLYLSCMLVQFFMYCWFGNEVTLKSADFALAIYQVDWTALRLTTTRTLIIMMLRAKRPIVISCGSIVTLSIKSFTSILKASYSAFNVLQRST